MVEGMNNDNHSSRVTSPDTSSKTTDMMQSNEERIGLMDAIDNINSQIYEQLGPDSTIQLEYTYGTVAEGVILMDRCIWSSEDDDREYIEDHDEFKGDYEPIEPFLRKKVMEVVNEMKKIQV